MVSIKERLWAKSIFEGQHEQKVLNFIAEEQVVTLEMIVENFHGFDGAICFRSWEGFDGKV